MDVTDELRHMLDDLGVEWDELRSMERGYRITRWKDDLGRYVSALDSGGTKYFLDFYWGPTAQQAIDATLGRGTCEVEAENEKLRELVRIAVKYCDSGTCDECPIQGESGSCPYSDMARELGIEVDA